MERLHSWSYMQRQLVEEKKQKKTMEVLLDTVVQHHWQYRSVTSLVC